MAEPQLEATVPDPEIFCSVLSRDVAEPLFATAVHNDVWFLLEYDGPWGDKATSENDLPAEIQAWLAGQVAATMGRGRVQFIKRERERPSDSLAFYIVQARETTPRMFQFQLAEYADLLEIDVAALLAANDRYEANLQATPLYLVCTNGRRDRCCALFGLEVYYALRELAGDAVWQTTHVGGHRFAANVLTFPDGTYYGRLHADDVEILYEALERREVPLDYLRGRSCYEEVVQAADYYLRQETGERDLQAFHVDGIWSAERDDFEVTFSAMDESAAYVVHLWREAVDLPIYASCGKPRVEPVDVYRLRSVRKMIVG